MIIGKQALNVGGRSAQGNIGENGNSNNHRRGLL
jgi:hypothetical protein